MVKSLKMMAISLLLIPLSCRAVELYDHFTTAIHAAERYVIYSHGLIVEGTDPRPISPKFGQYEFPAIKQALFSEGDFNLIAYQRPKNTDFDGYVGQEFSPRNGENWLAALQQAYDICNI